MLVLDRKPLTPAWASPMRQALEGVQGYKAGMTLAEAARRTGLSAFSKLASNENLLGPSPKVAEAVMAAMAEPHIYPDPHSDVLRAAIGARLGVSPARVVVSPGSEALIDYVFRAVLHPGDSILLSSPTFPTYEIDLQRRSGRTGGTVAQPLPAAGKATGGLGSDPWLCGAS